MPRNPHHQKSRSRLAVILIDKHHKVQWRLDVRLQAALKEAPVAASDFFKHRRVYPHAHVEGDDGDSDVLGGLPVDV